MKKEIEFINGLLKDYPRSQRQVNRPFLADAEIFPVHGGYAAASVDAVSEELEMGLIRDPKTLGWMTVTASVSDIAAVGMLTEHISVAFKNTENAAEFSQKFFSGVEEACAFYQIARLEKVETIGQHRLAACTAIGFSKDFPKMSRVQLSAGDHLFLTGPIGWGNAIAFANVAIRPTHPQAVDQLDQTYRPKARSQEGNFIHQYAHVCIDTSDGLLSTLKWLEILNKKHLQVNYSENLFHKVVLDISRMAKVDPWLFMAGQNGEFELLFAVNPGQRSGFLSSAAAKGFSLLEVGTVLEGEGLSLRLDDSFGNKEIPLPLGDLLDMLHDGVEPQKYILAMLQFAVKNGIQLKGW